MSVDLIGSFLDNFLPYIKPIFNIMFLPIIVGLIVKILLDKSLSFFISATTGLNRQGKEIIHLLTSAAGIFVTFKMYGVDIF